MSFLTFADIDVQCARFKQLKLEDIAKLEEWQRSQPHLPASLHPIETALFLHRSRYSIEAAKQRIDLYYTFRTRCPEFFAKRNPFELPFLRTLNISILTILPNSTPEGFVMIYARFLDANPEVFSFNEFVKIADLVIELEQKQRGCQSGYVCIIDLAGVTLSHILKINLLSLRKSLQYMEKICLIRVKSIHFVNSGSIVDKLMAVMQPLVKKELPIKVHFGDNSTIFKFVPKDILPIECGGSKLNATEYHRNVTRKSIEDNAEYIKVEQKQLVDESKRTDKFANFDNLFGIDGTFKQLDLD